MSSKSEGFSSLDRLLRFKPALSHDSQDSEDIDDSVYNEDGQFATDEVQQRDPRYVLGKKLLKFGRVHYRNIEFMPDWLQKRQSDICSHRTVPQIRRCLDKWTLKYDRELQDKYRTKKLGWGLIVADNNVTPLMMYGPEETVTYAHYFMPSRFALTKRVLQEFKLVLPSFQPKRVLDFGCGPATAGAAVAEVYGSICEKYTGTYLVICSYFVIKRNIQVPILLCVSICCYYCYCCFRYY